jgi:hypothetical protein
MTPEARLILRWAIKLSEKRGDLKTAKIAREALWYGNWRDVGVVVRF